MHGLTNSDLVNEVKYRLNNLEVDSLLSAGELEQLISDSNILGIPQIISTERPDKVSKHLLKGRVIVIVNGTPYGLIMPSILIDFLSSPEDTNLKPNFANFLRGLRLLAVLLLYYYLVCMLQLLDSTKKSFQLASYIPSSLQEKVFLFLLLLKF